MRPQLVDHAHTDSWIVIDCNLVKPRRRMNMFIPGCSCIAVASQLQSHHSRLTIDACENCAAQQVDRRSDVVTGGSMNRGARAPGGLIEWGRQKF